MKIKILNINTKRSDKDKLVFAFWIYFILLFIEGGLRKWTFPEISNIFLVIRDPIAIYALLMGLKYGYLKKFFPVFFISISIFAFITTMIYGHKNLIVALYGFRIYGINVPALFVWGSILTKTDIKKIIVATLYLLLISTLIIIIQYNSPQSAFINIGTGGNEDGSGFQGVNGYFRPSGTFSFTAGLALFEFLALACLLSKITTKESNKRQIFFILVTGIAYLLSVFFSLSRTIVAQTGILTLTFIILSASNRKRFLTSIFIISTIIIAGYITYKYSDDFKIAYNNLIQRFDDASNNEGNFINGSIRHRIFGSYIRAFTEPQNFTGKIIPDFGFGMGAGSKVGSKILNLDMSYTFGLAEEEWSLVVCEYGFFIGGLILIIGRFLFPCILFFKSITNKKTRNDNFCIYITIAFFSISMTSGLSVPTHLGFYVVTGALSLASINNNSRKNENIDIYS